MLPSCTALPLAGQALFTRSPANQRGRRGAWTRCADTVCSWRGKWLLCFAAGPCGRVRGEQRGGFPGAGQEALADPKVHPGSWSPEGACGCLWAGNVLGGVKGKCASEGISCLAVARAVDLEAPISSRLTSRKWCEKQPQSSKNPLGSGRGQGALLSLCGTIPFVLFASQTKQSKNLLSETARRRGHKSQASPKPSFGQRVCGTHRPSPSRPSCSRCSTPLYPPVCSLCSPERKWQGRVYILLLIPSSFQFLPAKLGNTLFMFPQPPSHLFRL